MLFGFSLQLIYIKNVCGQRISHNELLKWQSRTLSTNYNCINCITQKIPKSCNLCKCFIKNFKYLIATHKLDLNEKDKNWNDIFFFF